MAGNGLQQSRQPGYIQAELYLLALGFSCVNSVDSMLEFGKALFSRVSDNLGEL